MGGWGRSLGLEYLTNESPGVLMGVASAGLPPEVCIAYDVGFKTPVFFPLFGIVVLILDISIEEGRRRLTIQQV